MMRIIFVALVAVAGCGAPEPTARPYELRLHGADRGEFSAVLVDVQDVAVSAAGHALSLKYAHHGIDLANLDNAWLLSSFQLPSGVEGVHVVITVDDFGGFEAADDAGFVDAQNQKIEFDSPVAWLDTHHSATVELDLARSLVMRAPGARRLVPQIRVLY